MRFTWRIIINTFNFIVMKLISITEHSDWLFNQHISTDEKWSLHRQRVDFGKQPLELWMFVPCSVDGDVIPEPYNDEQHVIIQHLEYAEAKEKILFVWQDGFDYKGICEMFIDLEDIIDFDFELTQTAIKQLGL